MTDISITLDSTGVDRNMRILVFGWKIENVITSKHIRFAWKAFRSGNRASFPYPQETIVGVHYYSASSKTISVLKSEAAAPGTTWDYTAGAETLKINNSVPIRSDGTYAILNKRPDSGPGRVVDIGLYKDDRPFIIESLVGVGTYAEMHVPNKLYFAVVVHESPPGNIIYPTAFSELIENTKHTGATAQITELQEVDLNQFPDGVKVTLTQEKSTQRFIFSTEPKDL